MKCPRCSTTVPATPDAAGFLMCPGCGARLRSRSAAAAAATTGAPAQNPNATLPPGADVPPVPRPASMGPRPGSTPAPPVTLEAVMHELRAVRRLQESTLALLRSGEGGASRGGPEPMSFDPDPVESRPAPAPAAIRSHRRKSVLLIDDDAKSRDAAKAALERVEVPVRVARDGSEGLAAIAQEKPDVIVLELEMGGAMAGKDVINMIKATMEWVDVPIVLYTRGRVESQKEARTVHGADEFVIKGPQGADTLVARVIALFRKG